MSILALASCTETEEEPSLSQLLQLKMTFKTYLDCLLWLWHWKWGWETGANSMARWRPGNKYLPRHKLPLQCLRRMCIECVKGWKQIEDAIHVAKAASENSIEQWLSTWEQPVDPVRGDRKGRLITAASSRTDSSLGSRGFLFTSKGLRYLQNSITQAQDEQESATKQKARNSRIAKHGLDILFPSLSSFVFILHILLFLLFLFFWRKMSQNLDSRVFVGKPLELLHIYPISLPSSS